MPVQLYLDNAASSRPFDWALDCFVSAAKEFFGNQEAAGAFGLRSAKAVKDASARLASALAPGASVLWCNTGTESLAAAVHAHCMSHPGTEIVTTKAEHPALKQALLRFGKAFGLTVRTADIGRDGLIRTDSLIPLLSAHTSLLAVHHVNAETGAVQNLVELRALLDQHAPKARFLADTTQSVCKIAVPWKEAKLDMMTLSGCFAVARHAEPDGFEDFSGSARNSSRGRALSASRGGDDCKGRRNTDSETRGTGGAHRVDPRFHTGFDSGGDRSD